MASGKNVELAKAFMRRAKADLKSASDLLKAGDYADSVLHSQQCAEKAAKAHLILENKFVAKHVVTGVYSEIVGEDSALERVLRACEELERDWIRPRYPFPEEHGVWDPIANYKKQDAQRALESAEFVFNTIMQYLERRYGLKP